MSFIAGNQYEAECLLLKELLRCWQIVNIVRKKGKFTVNRVGIGEASVLLLQSPSDLTALLKVEENVVPTSYAGPKSETPKRISLRVRNLECNQTMSEYTLESTGTERFIFQSCIASQPWSNHSDISCDRPTNWTPDLEGVPAGRCPSTP
jgi:hypothetical protein